MPRSWSQRSRRRPRLRTPGIDGYRRYLIGAVAVIVLILACVTLGLRHRAASEPRVAAAPPVVESIGITAAQYAKVWKGMSEVEATKVLGGMGLLLDERLEGGRVMRTFAWSGSPEIDSRVLIVFADGKAVQRGTERDGLKPLP